MFYLRQATSATIMLGPYTDTSGVFVASLGATLTASVIQLSKNGGAFSSKNETTTASQRGGMSGYYSAMLDNTDTGSLGNLLVAMSSLNALPVWHEFTVLPSAKYDYFISPGSSMLMNMQLANMLAVDMSSLTVVVNARSPVNAFRAIRNRITTSGGIMAIYAENDSTAVWTATLTTNASADPIVESDPS